jgi:hypothetical protein
MTALWQALEPWLAVVGFITIVCFVAVVAIVATDRTAPASVDDDDDVADWDRHAEDAVRVARSWRRP